MAFIDKADYKDVINQNILDDITEVDDTKIDTSETKAIAFMKSFLSSRYDVANIFNKTAAARNDIILGYAKDITLYYLHRLINPRKVPAERRNAYMEAKEWLEGVAACRINPTDLPVIANGEKDYLLYGSNTKRENHI